MNAASALLVVDVQNAVMSVAARRDETIENIVECVRKARTADIPVVWVQHSGESIPRGSIEWQLVDRLAPDPGEPIVHKTYGDAFAETDLEAVLERLGATRFHLCGAMTDACVRSTLFGGLYRGYDVTLISDAHTTVDRDGMPFTAEQAIGLINAMADYSILPEACSTTTTTSDFPR